MWSKPKQHDAFVITITPRTITYSHLHRPTKESLIHLKSHSRKTVNALELEKLILCNPTTMSKQIKEQYQEVGNQSIPVLIALNGPSLPTKIISSTNAHPRLDQLNLPRTPHMQWAHRYLYSHEHLHYFYVCGLTRQVVLQYQLLAISAQLPLRVISSEHIALLQLYRHLSGSAFRHSTLGTALSEQKNRIEQLFSSDDLKRVLALPPHLAIADKDQIPLRAACGLFISEGL